MSVSKKIQSCSKTKSARPAAERITDFQTSSRRDEVDINNKSLKLQCKLSVGKTDDPLESEADTVADKVMQTSGQNVIPRKWSHCEKENKVQKNPVTSFIQWEKSNRNSVVDEPVHHKIDNSKGRENSIDAVTRSFMEDRFGTDFSSVKIHADPEAIQMSRELGARAFTVGNDVYFNENE